MKVFTCNDFVGFWPVGTAAVVIAEDVSQARCLLDGELHKLGLIQLAPPNEYTITEIDTTLQQAIILCDGDY